MASIESFLKINPNQEVKTEIVHLTLQGIEVEFKIRAVDPEILSDIQVANTVGIPSSIQGGPTTEGANPVRFALDLCTEAIVEPNLKSAQLQDHFGVYGERDLVHAMFRNDLDQLNELFTKILELSNSTAPKQRGVTQEDVNKAKN